MSKSVSQTDAFSVNEPRNRELYGSNSVAIQKFQAVHYSKFAEIMNRKYFAYHEFAINARYQGKKPQGRLVEQKSVCRFTFASVYFREVKFWPELQPRFSATCHSALADVYAVTIKASAKCQDSPRIH